MESASRHALDSAKFARRDAIVYARNHGCSLTAQYTGAAGGWLLELDAPDGKVFKHSGASVDSDIYGNGLLRSEIDWALVIGSIKKAIAAGFEEE